jgi:hypothetical protein
MPIVPSPGSFFSAVTASMRSRGTCSALCHVKASGCRKTTIFRKARESFGRARTSRRGPSMSGSCFHSARRKPCAEVVSDRNLVIFKGNIHFGEDAVAQRPSWSPLEHSRPAAATNRKLACRAGCGRRAASRGVPLACARAPVILRALRLSKARRPTRERVRAPRRV